MIKKILVPVDYSEASLNALESAIYIAEKHNATLYILHIQDIIPDTEASHASGNTKELYSAMAGNLMIKHGLKTNVIFAEGIVGHVIVKTIFETKTDLVIMGSHGESGHRNLFIGSNAYYVTKRATCPVLLIPPGKKWKEFEKILFPARPALFSSKLHHFIYELVKFNAQKCMVHVLDVSTDKLFSNEHWQSAITSELKNNDLAGKIEVAFSVNISADIAKSVLSSAKNIKADLLVISPGVDIATRPFFVGPFSQKIINHSRIPVLSILRSSENEAENWQKT
jgi:nucleotide-binding universal stress UspA family protein